MVDRGPKPDLLVIPCSGVGKVHGLISREAACHVADKLLPGRADTVCLALLVADDAETRQKVQETPSVTLDGCPKFCALKNVEMSGGTVAKAIRVYDAMKRHRGKDFGNATALSEAGWEVVEELAAEAAELATRQTEV